MKWILTITFETDQDPEKDQFLHTLLSDLKLYYGEASCKALDIGADDEDG